MKQRSGGDRVLNNAIIGMCERPVDPDGRSHLWRRAMDDIHGHEKARLSALVARYF